MKPLEQEAETQLVHRLYARDEAALTLFYQQYGRALYHTIWRIVRHNELAEDILQECILKFWMAFSSYDPAKGKLFTWALRIGRNLAIDRLREQRLATQRTQSLTNDLADTQAAPQSFRPEHIGVRDWLHLLSPRDRQLLELLYLEGYTQTEAAEALSLPLGTVKSRSIRIIRALARVVN